MPLSVFAGKEEELRQFVLEIRQHLGQ